MSFLAPSPGPHSEQALIPAQRGAVDPLRVEGNPDGAPVRWANGAPPALEFTTLDLGVTETFCLQSPLDCIYFRLYTDPDELPLGIIGGDVEATIRIWNSQIEAATVVSIESSFELCDAEGEPLPEPFTLGETQLFDIVVKVPGDGLATQSESIVINLLTANGEARQIEIPISLIRAVVWPYPPHFETWRQSFRFRTAITITEDGTEQRHSLTPQPQMAFSGEYWTVGQATPEIRAVPWGEGQVIAGDWSRSMVLNAPVSVGEFVLPVAARDVHFHPNQTLIIVRGTEPWLHPFELVQAMLEQTADGVILITSPTTMDWPAGSRVVPAHFSSFEGDFSGEHRTNCFFTGTSEFRVMDEIRLPEIEPPMLDGIPVFEKSPDWNTLPNWEIGRENQLFEGINSAQYYEHHFRGRSASGFNFLFRGQEQVQELLGWIQLWRGRWKTFYMPTWVNDLTATESSGQLFTAHRGLSTPESIYNEERGRDAVFVARGSQIGYGKIVGRVTTGEETVISTEPPLPIIRNPGVAGYLQEVRLQDDTITIEFEARDCARLTLNVRTV